MERTVSKFRSLLVGLALTGLVFVPVPEVSFLSRHALFAGVLENSAHPVVFGLVAAVARRAGLRAWPVLGLVALLGGGTELLQHYTGRDGSWVDVGNDLLGAGFALAVLGRSRGVAALCAALAAAPMAITLVAYLYRAALFPLLWQEGVWLFRPFVSANGPPYPGFSLDEPVADWRGWRALQVEVESGADEAVNVTLRVHDGQHRLTYTDRYNETFRLAPRTQRVIEVPLSRIEQAPQGRLMDLADIRGVMLFQAGGQGPPAFTVIAVRLLR